MESISERGNIQGLWGVEMKELLLLDVDGV